LEQLFTKYCSRSAVMSIRTWSAARNGGELKLGYEVLANQVTPAQGRVKSLEVERKKLAEEIVCSDDWGGAIQKCMAGGNQRVTLADYSAVESQIKSRVKLSDQTVFHQAQANAKSSGEFLAQQKSMTDMLPMQRSALMQKTFDGIDSRGQGSYRSCMGLDRYSSRSVSSIEA